MVNKKGCGMLLLKETSNNPDRKDGNIHCGEYFSFIGKKVYCTNCSKEEESQ